MCLQLRQSLLVNHEADRLRISALATRQKMKAAVILSVVATFLLPPGHCKMPVASDHAKMWPQFVSARARDIEKRQLLGTCTLEELTAGHPQDCESELQSTNNALMSSLNRTLAAAFQNQTALSDFLDQFSAGIGTISEIICRPRCGNPYITSYSRCGLPEVANMFRALCTRNEAGQLCFERADNILFDDFRVQSSCINSRVSSCTTNCRRALEAIRGSSGCCLNVYNTSSLRSTVDGINMIYGSIVNITSSIVHYDLWSSCNVTTPGFCNLEESTLAASSAEILHFTEVLILLTSIAVMVALL